MAMAQTKIFPWFFDLDNGRMVIDARWFDHVGIPRGDCSMSPGIFFDMLHPDDRETLSAAFAKQLSGILTPEAYAYRVRRCDGTWEWFEGQSVYLGQAHDGSPYRVVGICQSIQPHKEIEGHLREARDKARENDRLKSAFLANMSHEIRTPLNAIVGFSELLADESRHETRREYTDIILRNNTLLLQIISDVLDLARIESGRTDIERTQFDARDLCREVADSLRLQRRPGVELRVEEGLPEFPVTEYRKGLAQVLNNFTRNALKFTEKGSVTIGFRRIPGHIRFYVRDTGIGIAPEDRERIFERFVKLDTFTQGTGLGLSICKSIAEQLGSSVGVDSVAGEGSCFRIDIPAGE